MIEPIEFTESNIVGYRVRGKVTQADIRPWATSLDSMIKQQGKLRLYVEYEGMDDLTLNALLEDFKFDVAHLNDFEKAAVVSNKNWVSAVSAVANVLPNLDVKTFSFAEKEQAQQWVRS